MTRGGPSRREVLAGGGLLVLAGCLPLDGSAPQPTVPPEVRLRARIAAEVEDLAARYDAVVARFPDTRGELSTLAAEHQAHAEALLGPRATADRPSGSPTATAVSPDGSAPTPPPVPSTVAAARAALADAERAASHRRAAQARDASPVLARLLASIAGCEAAHAALLTRGADA